MRWFTRVGRGYAAVAIFCLNVLVVFGALNAIAWLFHPAPERGPDGEPWPGLRQNVASHVYPELDGDDADALARETIPRFRCEPYTDIRERPLAGRFVNLDEAGFRHSMGRTFSRRGDVRHLGRQLRLGHDGRPPARRLASFSAALPTSTPGSGAR